MSCFQFEVLMNNAVMNICVQVLLFLSGVYLHIEQPNPVATLCVSLGRTAHTVSQSACTIAHPHQWYTKVPVSTLPKQQMLFSFRLFSKLQLLWFVCGVFSKRLIY